MFLSSIFRNFLKSIPKTWQGKQIRLQSFSNKGYTLESRMKVQQNAFYVMFKLPQGFEAEDLVIKVIGTEISVEGRKSKQSEASLYSRSMSRKFTFGKCLDLKKISCVLHNGMVEIQGPFKDCDSDSNTEHTLSITSK